MLRRPGPTERSASVCETGPIHHAHSKNSLSSISSGVHLEGCLHALVTSLSSKNVALGATLQTEYNRRGMKDADERNRGVTPALTHTMTELGCHHIFRLVRKSRHTKLVPLSDHCTASWFPSRCWAIIHTWYILVRTENRLCFCHLSVSHLACETKYTLSQTQDT